MKRNQPSDSQYDYIIYRAQKKTAIGVYSELALLQQLQNPNVDSDKKLAIITKLVEQKDAELIAKAFNKESVIEAVPGLIWLYKNDSKLCEQILDYLPKNSATLDIADKTGFTLMHYMAYKPNPELFKKLVSKGADVKVKDSEGFMALHTLIDRCQKGYVSEDVSIPIIEYLIEQGAKIASDEVGTTKAHLEFIEALKPNSFSLLDSKPLNQSDSAATDVVGETCVEDSE